MAKRSRQSFLKRQRERQRAEKAALKRQKRLERKRAQADGEAEELEPGADPTLAEPVDPLADLEAEPESRPDRLEPTPAVAESTSDRPE